MDEFRSNSDKEKLAHENSDKRKEIKAVVKEETQLQKKSWLSKFVHTFISNDIDSVSEAIVNDVVVPAVKKTAYEIINNGTYMLLNDDSGSLRKAISRTMYGGYYDSDIDRGRPLSNSRKDTNLRNYRSGSQPYDSVSFSNRPDAETVLEAMLDIISAYDSVSVAEYYELARIPNENYTFNNWGWTDLSSAKIIQVRNRYVIKLPKAIQLRQGR